MSRTSNRLINETSPYLLQHAHNPVDWYPWGDEALQKARELDKPILISIGYSACHWCHVMERESFEDPAVAAIMNEHFINIKIDREERPDIDAIYMDAVQMISGSGGWPLNVFLTPDARPFYGGTYFPPVRAYNRSSWKEVLGSIAQVWSERREEVLTQAENLTKHLITASTMGDAAKDDGLFSKERAKRTAEALLKVADTQWGGFGKAPKFPQTFSIQYLLRHYHFTGEQQALDQALLSLDKMIQGGIYDQIGGGFARYSTDNEWLAPHFEKMLYDNALLISVLSEAYQLTGIRSYETTVRQTMSFIRSQWVSPLGGFYSAYDADSEGEEGRYYTWQYDDVVALLGDDAPLFCQFYDVSIEGNWEGTNILWVKKPIEAFYEEWSLDLTETSARIDRCKEKLLAARAEREMPLLDDKIIMGWNALMITACCKAYAALGDERYLQMALNAQAFIETHLRDEQGLYHHNYKLKASNPAFLDDLAFYVQALIHLQEVTGQNDHLLLAEQVVATVFASYEVEGQPLFCYTPSWQTDVIVRKQDLYDGATPAGNSVMAFCLLYLSIIFDRKDYRERAMRMLARTIDLADRYPTSFSHWACTQQLLVHGIYEIAVCGSEAGPVLTDILRRYCPNKVLQTQLAPAEAFPLLKGRWPSGPDVKVYLCRDHACKAPVNDADELWALL